MLNPGWVRTVRPRGFFLLAFLCASAFGAAVPVAKIKQALQERFPEIVVESIEASPMQGLYAVLTPEQIFYTDSNVDRIFVGRIVDAKTHEDLTAKHLQESLRIDFKSLPFDKAIAISKGNGSRKLAVFADPECPFCQKLELALANVTDVTVYVFLFPLTELHPGAEKIARDVWCSKDRAAAWTGWMTQRIAPQPSASCAQDPIADIQALSQKLKIDGTPTLFFVDGIRTADALSAEQIERALSERVAVHRDSNATTP